MDLWVVAAAAGAGYLAKHWQKFLRDKDDPSGSSSERTYRDEPQSPSLIDRIRDKTCPIEKLSQTRTEIGRDGRSGEIVTDSCRGNGCIGADASCISNSNQEEIVRDDVGSMPPQFLIPPDFRNANSEDYRDGYLLDVGMSDIPENHSGEMGASHGSRRYKNSFKSRRLHLQVIKPRTSLDSCLMAQMHRENSDVEEYLLTPLSSPCTPSLRPFLVTDGKRVISRASYEFRNGPHNSVLPNAGNVVFGVPHLPQIQAADGLPQRLNGGKSQVEESRYPSKEKWGKNQIEDSLFRSNLRPSDTTAGFSSGQALFCLGISIGILSTIIANKLELEKLKQRLKLSENLVDDLQEELEMKDSLTVKELANDDDSQDIQGCLNGSEINLFSSEHGENALIIYADEASVCKKKDESIRNIEAELEAELERLELTMKGSTLTGSGGGVELEDFDSDSIAELVQGELKADNVCRRSSSGSTPIRESHSPTPQSAKDGVSARELTLRLHEVIKSRLEERIIELEGQLEKSQNRVQLLISEKTNHWRDVSPSGSSSSRCSPRTIENHYPIARPLVMNLSGDALDAYNEAFEELDKLKESEDDPRQTLNSEQGTDGKQKGIVSGDVTWLPSKGEEAVPISITGIPSSEDSPNESYNSDDGDYDLLLIKQIVEKARQGSPAILRAQKAMVSLDRGDYYQV